MICIYQPCFIIFFIFIIPNFFTSHIILDLNRKTCTRLTFKTLEIQINFIEKTKTERVGENGKKIAVKNNKIQGSEKGD